MAELWAGAVAKLEEILPMEGPMAIPARAAIGAGVGYLIMQAVRPGFAYTPEGQPRQDVNFPDVFPGAQPPTATPWWTGPALGALVFTSLI